MTETDTKSLIAGGDSLSVEFKRRGRGEPKCERSALRVLSRAGSFWREFSCDSFNSSPSFRENTNR